MKKDIFIHKTAIIKRPKLVSWGNHVAIDPFFYITTAAQLGNWIHISSHVSVIGGETGELVMEDFTSISTGCRLICVTDDFAEGTGFINPFVPKEYRAKHLGHTITMRKHSALGANVVVFPNVTIGEGAVVGANSVVLESLLPWGIYVGTPARLLRERPIGTILEYERRINEKYPSR